MPRWEERLEAVRLDIDMIDREILALFARRMELCGHVADIKKAGKLQVLDTNREKAVLENARGRVGADLREEAAALMACLMELSKKRQEKILK